MHAEGKKYAGINVKKVCMDRDVFTELLSPHAVM
jgi:hypothetical protein